MTSTLGLNDHHQAAICNYMRFARFRRSQNLHAIEVCFENIKSSRLLEDTYTAEEVHTIIDDLAAVVRADVETEMINSTNTNALLLQQIFSQAEKWHLKLQADTTDLENRELLDNIRDFEINQLSKSHPESCSPQSPIKVKLEPIHDYGGAELLKMEIERLTQDNNKLRDRVKQMELRLSEFLHDRSQLNETLRSTSDELKDLKCEHAARVDQGVSQLQEQLANTRLALEELKTNSTPKHDLEANLAHAKHALLQVQSQLESAQMELGSKFNQTAAYTNMKTMIQQKNDIIKSLRLKLRQYEPEADATQD